MINWFNYEQTVWYCCSTAGDPHYYELCFLYRIKTGVQDTFMTYEVYKDDITLQLVEKACQMLGKCTCKILIIHAIYWWLKVIVKRSDSMTLDERNALINMYLRDAYDYLLSVMYIHSSNQYTHNQGTWGCQYAAIFDFSSVILKNGMECKCISWMTRHLRDIWRSTVWMSE